MSPSRAVTAIRNTARERTTDTYKIEGELALTPDIRFRGGYNRAVRAPTVQDLFAPQRVALDGATDPCAGHADRCRRRAVLPRVSPWVRSLAENPAQQYNGQIGGNVDLIPEMADTYTAGVVLTPPFLRGLSIRRRLLQHPGERRDPGDRC